MASTIILSDNGASSGSAGLKQTAGNDGVLILQTTTSGGTATNAIYVDTSQNVGLSVTPGSWGSSYKALEIKAAGNSLWSAAANDVRLMTNAVHNGSNYIVQVTGATGMYSQSGGAHSFFSSSGTGGVALSSWTTVAQVAKDQTFALQGATQSSGTGIAFPATQSASSDANTLDDYEEGTWTPAFARDGGSVSITYSVQTGVYTKVGNVVCVEALLVVTGVSAQGGSGAISVTGFPFASTKGNSYGRVMLIGYNDVFEDQAITRGWMSSNYMYLMPAGVTQSGYGGTFTTGYFAISGCYLTD